LISFNLHDEQVSQQPRMLSLITFCHISRSFQFVLSHEQAAFLLHQKECVTQHKVLTPFPFRPEEKKAIRTGKLFALLVMNQT
jgi:hypothetical protein